MPALYLLDSSVLITANASYYEYGRIPHFWEWISRRARAGRIKIPVPVLNELTPSRKDPNFLAWLNANISDLSFTEPHFHSSLMHVLRRGYGFSPSAIAAGDAAQTENDALLVAMALAGGNSRCVVTLERPQDPTATLPKPGNRRIPLVCGLLGVRCVDTFGLIRELDFRIPL